MAETNHTCTSGLPFAQVISLGYYHDPLLRPVVTELKFNGVTALGLSIKEFMQERFDGHLEGVLVPMPLSFKREKERGFNQAGLLAELFASVLGLEVSECLKRVGHKDPQSGLDHDLEVRRQNIKDCFKVEGEVPKKLILVDDVVTTGATAAEAARIMLDSGAESVSVLTLAIGA